LGLHIYGGDEEETDGAREIFVVILRRTCSVSKSSAFSDVLWANEKQKKEQYCEEASYIWVLSAC
jgi:hypothetical protein